MFKSWIKDVTEAKKYSEVHMSSTTREPGKPNTLVGTDGFRKHVEKMTPGATTYGQQFINKYRKK